MGREQVSWLMGSVKNSADEYHVTFKDLVPVDTILKLISPELKSKYAIEMQNELVHQVEQVVASYINRNVQGLIGPGYDVSYASMMHMIGHMQATPPETWNYPAYNASFTDKY